MLKTDNTVFTDFEAREGFLRQWEKHLTGFHHL